MEIIAAIVITVTAFMFVEFISTTLSKEELENEGLVEW